MRLSWSVFSAVRQIDGALESACVLFWVARERARLVDVELPVKLDGWPLN